MKFQLVVNEEHASDAYGIFQNETDISIQRRKGLVYFTFEKGSPSKEAVSKSIILFPELEMAEVSGKSRKKVPLTLPELLVGLMNCPNPLCVSSQPKEPAVPELRVLRVSPLLLRCEYCGRYVARESLSPSLMEVTKFIPQSKKIQTKV